LSHVGVMAESLPEGKYDKDFNPLLYLNERLGIDWITAQRNNGDRDRVLFPLQCYHEFFATSELAARRNISFLDYGIGPNLSALISAAPHASEMILCDYTDSNLEYLQQWVNKVPTGYDWTPHFEYVVNYLERNEKEDAVKEREELIRNTVKAIVPGDLTKESVIQSGYEGPYDVVHLALTLDVTAKTVDDYKAQIKKVASLVKPGGKIILLEVERRMGLEYFYEHAGRTWHFLGVTCEFVANTLEEAGFTDVYVKTAGPADKTKHRNYMFFSATKAV